MKIEAVFFGFQREDCPMTGSTNFYFPDPVWSLIFEFYDTSAIRREKKMIAEACAEYVTNKNLWMEEIHFIL